MRHMSAIFADLGRSASRTLDIGAATFFTSLVIVEIDSHILTSFPFWTHIVICCNYYRLCRRFFRFLLASHNLFIRIGSLSTNDSSWRIVLLYSLWLRWRCFLFFTYHPSSVYVYVPPICWCLSWKLDIRIYILINPTMRSVNLARRFRQMINARNLVFTRSTSHLFCQKWYFVYYSYEHTFTIFANNHYKSGVIISVFGCHLSSL